MTKQREKWAPTADQLSATLGGKCERASGGMIENFREGWALNVMGKEPMKAHYFQRSSFSEGGALCGIFVPVRNLYGPGNYPKCKKCERMRKRFV